MIIIKFTRIEEPLQNDVFENVNPNYLSGVVNWQLASTLNAWNPPYDLLETEQEYIVRVEIAGMCEDDFDVSFDSRFVYIKGRRIDDMEFLTFHQMEIPFGEFSFKVEIPGSVDIDRVKGDYANGFLTVHLPKHPSITISLPSSSNNEK